MQLYILKHTQLPAVGEWLPLSDMLIKDKITEVKET